MALDFLSGVRVLDLSQFLPGPFAAQMLADMGADVLKVEPPKGDPMRELNPISNARGPAPFHALINAGKRIVGIDLKSETDRAAFEALVERADVLLESYRPDVMARLGFGSARLAEINPRLVHCALSGYGQNGPQRLYAGHDINYLAMTGALLASGPEAKPVQPFPPQVDYGAALQAVIAVLGGLLGRQRPGGGKGCFLDLAMADALVAWQASSLAEEALAAAEGRAGARRGVDLLNGGAACYQVYETADGGYISLGAVEEVFWRNFCAAVGREDWAGRQLEAMPQTALIAEVGALVKSRPRRHWQALLGPVDCCYHPVLAYGEVADWPQVAARKIIDDGGRAGGFRGVRFPVWTDGAPPPDRDDATFITIKEALTGWDYV